MLFFGISVANFLVNSATFSAHVEGSGGGLSSILHLSTGEVIATTAEGTSMVIIDFLGRLIFGRLIDFFWGQCIGKHRGGKGEEEMVDWN